MGMLGEQVGGPTLTDAQRRKIEKDKIRVRRGNVQRKRLHVLNNPSKLAFRGWEKVPEPWTYADCEEYIEWCHIDKNSLRSGIEIIGSQTKKISGSAHVWTLHNGA
jgi:hypothetical protein